MPLSFHIAAAHVLQYKGELFSLHFSAHVHPNVFLCYSSLATRDCVARVCISGSWVSLSLNVGYQVVLLTALQSRGCGTVISRAERRTAEADFVAHRVESLRAQQFVNITIPVHFHVISAGDALTQGNIP